MVTFLLVISVIFNLILAFVAINLYRKVVFYESWYQNFATVVETIYEKLQAMDELGSFESDDEVGYFFEALKQMLMDLFAMGFYSTEEITETEREEVWP